jgi:hypothetical protein
MLNVERIATLNEKQIRRLKHAVAESLVEPANDAGIPTLKELRADLAANSPVVSRSTAIALSKQLGATVAPNDFSMRIERLDETDFRVESDIPNRFGLDAQTTHRLLEGALLAVGSLNKRVEHMQTYQTLTGFTEADLPLFETKLSFLGRLLDPDAQEERFRRILSITGLPDFRGEEGNKIDAHRLLEIRSTPECRAFREWLHSTDSQSVDEIEERFKGLREKLGEAYHGKLGKAVRLGVTSGIGLIPVVGTVAGLGASLLDTFLLDKVVPQPGPTSFLSHLYPSIFEKDALASAEEAGQVVE